LKLSPILQDGEKIPGKITPKLFKKTEEQISDCCTQQRNPTSVINAEFAEKDH
jgi:hypothetical protein